MFINRYVDSNLYVRSYGYLVVNIDERWIIVILICTYIIIGRNGHANVYIIILIKGYEWVYIVTFVNHNGY